MIILASAPPLPTVTFHKDWASVVLIYSLVLALWGLGLFLTGRNPSGGYLGAILIDEVVIVVQAVSGLVLVGFGARPEDALHFLYGLVSLLALPFAYTMSARGAERRDSLYFAIAAAFLVGASIRAAATGG